MSINATHLVKLIQSILPILIIGVCFNMILSNVYKEIEDLRGKFLNFSMDRLKELTAFMNAVADIKCNSMRTDRFEFIDTTKEEK